MQSGVDGLALKGDCGKGCMVSIYTRHFTVHSLLTMSSVIDH